ncbi:YncE family protein [Jongsikchunia kroppenstedtii]|uniref:YncE family protein n=1 Tax=Jongsikchunia kroppenstedtii TaxID=1121721 RepID=UPI0003A8B7FD|nr:hypothetical protein [Jongsikchunia kroppenstedtii]
MKSVRRTAGAVATGAVVVMLAVGCSSSKSSSVATTEPATPASATAVSQPPAGIVVPSGPIKQVVALPVPGQAATLSTDGRSLVITTFHNPAERRPLVGTPPTTHTISLPASAAAVAAGPTGLLAAVPDAVLTIDPGTGAIARREISAPDPLSITAVDGDTTAVGTADGKVLLVHRSGDVDTISGLVRVDSLAAHDGRLVALDRAQSAIAEVDLSKKEFEGRQRAGNGAANVIADRYGRFLITNPRDGQLISFYGDPPVERFAFPVPNGPYGVAYDDNRNVAWVAESGANTVTGYELASGMPIQTKQSPTVRQPDSIAVDAAGGTLFIGSAAGDGLQAIALG